MKTKLNLTGAAFIGLMTAALSVNGTVVVLGPSEALNGPLANGSASIDTTSSQAAIGTGAWQANGTAVSQYYLYYSAGLDRGLGQLKVSDLTSLSFETFKSTTGGSAQDWFINIYTKNTSGGVVDGNNDATWYGRRLTLEGLYANNFVNPANQWNTWSTDSGNNQLTVFDGNRTALGWYYPPTLADIQAGAVDWDSYGDPNHSGTFDYSSLDILGIVLSTGSPWASGFDGLVDDVQINTLNGSVTFDLEPVPEPTTMIAGALLLLPFGASMFRRLRKNRMA